MNRSNVWNRAGRRAAAMAAVLALALAVLAPLTVRAESADEGDTTASITFTKGDIALVDAPHLNFGSHRADLTSDAFGIVENVGVKVSDARGTGEGWTLTVDLSAFVLEGSETLEGARIEVESPVVSPLNGTLNKNAPTVPLDENGVLRIVSGGGATKVLEAPAGYGRGVWQALWETDNTSLVIKPGTAEVSDAGNASIATLHWALTEAP